MKNIIEKFQKTFSAIAFAEVGEFDKAVDILESKSRKAKPVDSKQLNGEWLERTFASVAFAEANCHEEALELLNEKPVRKSRLNRLNTFIESVGLRGAEIRYGIVSV
jgi:hypothetical protein